MFSNLFFFGRGFSNLFFTTVAESRGQRDKFNTAKDFFNQKSACSLKSIPKPTQKARETAELFLTITATKRKRNPKGKKIISLAESFL